MFFLGLFVSRVFLLGLFLFSYVLFCRKMSKSPGLTPHDGILRVAALTMFGNDSPATSITNVTSPTTTPRHRVVNMMAPSAEGPQEPKCASPVSIVSPRTKVAREKIANIRAQRRAFFSAFETPCAAKGSSHMRCTHFGVAVMALSFLGSTRVTLDDLFFAAQLPLKYVMHSAMTLAELYDVVTEFISHDKRFGAANYVADVTHMDTSIASGEVGHGYLAMETSHRRVVETVSDIREGIIEECATMSDVRIVNFDQTVMEHGLVLLEDDDSGDDSEGGIVNMVISPSVQRMKANCVNTRSSSNSQGTFAVVADYNAAQHLVFMSTAALDTDVHALCTEAPLSTLYKAMCKGNGYVNRPRGYIRIRRRSLPLVPRALPSSVIPTDLRTLSKVIAPHLISIAYALHILRPEKATTVLLSDIIRTVRIPFDFFSTRQVRLGVLRDVLTSYLDAKGISGEYAVQMDTISTVLCREDSQTTLSIIGLEAILRDRLTHPHTVFNR